MAYVPKGTYNDQWIRENDPNAWSQIEKYKQDYAAAQAAGNQAMTTGWTRVTSTAGLRRNMRANIWIISTA